jgi:ketosteroid isomerase-like protein
MKKEFLISTIAAMFIIACQQVPKTVPVDKEAEKAVIDSLFDKFHAAWNTNDVASLASFLTDDALSMGSDPSEFFTKQQITDAWKQMLADSVPEIILLNERKIVVAPDGHSATVVDQYMMPGIVAGIPLRNAYHLIKTDGQWKILVLNCSYIHKNEDLPKIFEALAGNPK